MAQRARRRIRKIDGHQYAPRFDASATTLRGCFRFHAAHVLAWQSWPAERRLLTPLHGAKQRATPTLVVPGPSLVAGEFRRRSDRSFVGWPFRTSSLPEFPSQAQRWRLLFVSTEILRSVFSGRAQDSFEFPSDWLPMVAVLHIPVGVLHLEASCCKGPWSLEFPDLALADSPNPKRRRWRRKNRIPQES